MHYDTNTFQAFLDDALSIEEFRDVESHLEGCNTCQTQLTALKLEIQQVLSKMEHLQTPEIPTPSAQVQLQLLKARLQKDVESESVSPQGKDSSSSWLTIWSRLVRPQWALPTVFAALALVLWVNPFGKDTNTHQLTAKGLIPGFKMLHAKATSSGKQPDPKGVQLLDNGAVVGPRDFVQFQYNLSQNSNAMIVGIHENGAIFPYAPLQGKQSIALSKGKGILPKTILLELDDDLGMERFVMVVANQPFTFQQLKEMIRRFKTKPGFDLRKNIVFPEGWFSRSLWVDKQSKRKSGVIP